MSARHSNFFARDANGVKLVVGQTVYSKTHGKTGQVLGVTHPEKMCMVRFVDTGEVMNIAASQLKIATWSQIREGGRATSSAVRPRVRHHDEPSN